MNLEDNTPNVDTTPENTEITVEDTSLDDFEAEFFNPGKAPEPQPVEEEPEEEVDTDSNDENLTETEDSEDDSAEENEDNDSPPKKETRAEKRIRELNAKYREEERKRQELEERLAQLEKGAVETPDETKTPEPVNKSDESRAPHWDDEDENGNKLYPLGQFDPKFTADLTRFTVQEEQRQYEKRQQELNTRRQLEETEKAAQEAWNEKLTPALERYPDYAEKGQKLVEQFSDLEPAYGKYLTDTIRAIDNGPEVFYHLASNPELAKAIVSRGPSAATVELGRLSAMLDTGENTSKTLTRTKVTKASPPPPKVKGSALPKNKDLDDLDDFESVFFRK